MKTFLATVFGNKAQAITNKNPRKYQSWASHNPSLTRIASLKKDLDNTIFAMCHVLEFNSPGCLVIAPQLSPR